MRGDYTLDKYGGSDYIVVRECETHEEIFRLEVDNLMKEGFEPIGGVAVRVGTSSGADLLQAMIYKGDAFE